MRPYDGQSEALWNIENLLDWPDLGAEELGRIALMLDRFVESDLVSREEAARLLAARMAGVTR